MPPILRKPPDTLRKSNMACCKIHHFVRCFCHWHLHLVLGFSIATFKYRRLPTLGDCYSTIGNHNGPCKDQWNISHNTNTMFGCHFFWHDSRFLSISKLSPEPNWSNTEKCHGFWWVFCFPVFPGWASKKPWKSQWSLTNKWSKRHLLSLLHMISHLDSAFTW